MRRDLWMPVTVALFLHGLLITFLYGLPEVTRWKEFVPVRIVDAPPSRKETVDARGRKEPSPALKGRSSPADGLDAGERVEDAAITSSRSLPPGEEKARNAPTPSAIPSLPNPASLAGPVAGSTPAPGRDVGTAPDAASPAGAGVSAEASVADGGGASGPKGRETGVREDGVDAPLSATAFASLCPGAAVPRGLEGQGLFPRRYRILLRYLADEGAYSVEDFFPAPGVPSLPYLDAKLLDLTRRRCGWRRDTLAAVLPTRFANGDPATLALLLEFTEEGAR